MHNYNIQEDSSQAQFDAQLYLFISENDKAQLFHNRLSKFATGLNGGSLLVPSSLIISNSESFWRGVCNRVTGLSIEQVSTHPPLAILPSFY